jgi:hypothetical protein
VLQDKLDTRKDLEGLLQELDGIQTDLSLYVTFLVNRQNLIDRVFSDGPGTNN